MDRIQEPATEDVGVREIYRLGEEGATFKVVNLLGYDWEQN